MDIRFSQEELNDLLWAWAAITFAFAVVLSGGFGGLGPAFVLNLTVAGISVGTAFLVHELSHKIVAQRYGCWAEFRKFNFGLFLAVAMSFFGFIIAAPGAVLINGFVSRDQNGKIALAGPLSNIVLAILFLITGILLPQAIKEIPPLISQVIFVGFVINTWLALFNMIPFPPLDGSKVISWSFPVWLGITILTVILLHFR